MAYDERVRSIQSYTLKWDDEEDFSQYKEKEGQVSVAHSIMGEGSILYEIELSYENIAEFILRWDAEIPQGASIRIYYREYYPDAVSKDQDSDHFQMSMPPDANYIEIEGSQKGHRNHFIVNKSSEYGLKMYYRETGLSIERDSKLHSYYVQKADYSDNFTMGLDNEGVYYNEFGSHSYESGWNEVEQEEEISAAKQTRLVHGTLQLKIELESNAWDEVPELETLYLDLFQVRRFILPERSYGYRLYNMNHRYRGEMEYKKHSLFVHQLAVEINRLNDIYNMGIEPLSDGVKDIRPIYITKEKEDYISNLPDDIHIKLDEEEIYFIGLDKLKLETNKLESKIDSIVSTKWR